MSIEEQRKAFEEWFFEFLGDSHRANESHYICAWESWLASENREGYKLVPVEPEFETLQEMNTTFIENRGETPKYRMQQVYRASIGE